MREEEEENHFQDLSGNRARPLPLPRLPSPRPLPRVQILISTIFAVFLPLSQSPRNPFLRMVLCPARRSLNFVPDLRWVSLARTRTCTLPSDGPQCRKLFTVQFSSKLAMIFNLPRSSPRPERESWVGKECHYDWQSVQLDLSLLPKTWTPLYPLSLLRPSRFKPVQSASKNPISLEVRTFLFFRETGIRYWARCLDVSVKSIMIMDLDGVNFWLRNREILFNFTIRFARLITRIPPTRASEILRDCREERKAKALFLAKYFDPAILPRGMGLDFISAEKL